MLSQKLPQALMLSVLSFRFQCFLSALNILGGSVQSAHDPEEILDSGRAVLCCERLRYLDMHSIAASVVKTKPEGQAGCLPSSALATGP